MTPPTDPPAPAQNPGTVSIAIDFSNGVHKTFANVPLDPAQIQDRSILAVLDAAKNLPPGLDYKLNTRGTDRGSNTIASITAIDSVIADSPNQQWLFWINHELRDPEIRFGGSGSVGRHPLQPGDAILFKISTRKD